MTISSIGALPMWWSLGHHDVMSAVKTANARAADTGTTTSRRIDSTAWITPAPLCLGCLLERGQRPLPELVQVGPQDREPRGIDLVEPSCAVATIVDEPDVLEHLQVLGDGRTADGKLACELSDRPRPVGEPVEDRLARRIPQRRHHVRSVRHDER